MFIPDITVEELAQKLSQPDLQLQLVDVREPWECEVVSLPNFINLPLSEFEQWSPTIQQKLDPNVETLVLCHHGVRSAQMCYWLMQNGFLRVQNIAGGIHAYSVRIDPSLNKY
jgi:rhodanese-related sulfurtransferase